MEPISINEYADSQEKQQDNLEEQSQEESDDNLEDNKIIDSVAEKVEVPVDIENNNPNNSEEQSPNLNTMTQGVTLSEDATTEAVLNEIAEEKAQDVKAMTTSDKLFMELENTYRDEDVKNKENKNVSSNEQTSENKTSDLEVDLTEDIAKEDEFLKTFTTSVEEVFLDQPTEIISDYVPPNSDGTVHTKPETSDTNIKREKPSDIKTVPLVPNNLGQEIWSSPYVESGTAKLGRTSALSNLIKWVFIISLIAVIIVGALSALAVMGIVPESISPIHTIIYSLQKTPQTANISEEDDIDLAPEIISQNVAAEVEQSVVEQNQDSDMLSQIKGYQFPDGITLEEVINTAHKNIINEIEWSLFPTEEYGIYSVAIKIPQNKDGQGFSYRFNYNMMENMLTPTTSEAKNVIEIHVQ